MQLYMRKNENGHLVPSDDISLGVYERKIKTGRDYLFEAKSPRNPRFHKKFWALLKTVYDAQYKFSNVEGLKAFLLVKSGYFTGFLGSEGQYMCIPDSISFASMDEENFSKVYDACIDTSISFLEEQGIFSYNNENLKEIISEIVRFD